MRIGIRVDASYGIGSGHVFRCANLATALQRIGLTPIFFMREGSDSLTEFVNGLGFKVVCLTFPHAGSHENPFFLDVAKDAQFFIESAISQSIDAVLVDHYGADADWESRVGRNFPVFAIDDFLDRRHSAKLVINPNYLCREDVELFKSNSPESDCLSGSMFALLKSHSCFDSSFTRNTEGLPPISLYFGASDPGGITLTVLQTLLEEIKVKNFIHVIVGINSSYKERITAFAQQFNNVQIHEFVDDLGSIFSIAPIAIGAGGSTIWDRLLFKNHTLVIAIAENQMPLSKNLASIGAVDFIGELSELTSQELFIGIEKHIRNYQNFSFDASKLLIDRHGTERVAFLIKLALGEKVDLSLSQSVGGNKENGFHAEFDLMWLELFICKISIKQNKNVLEILIRDNEFSECLRNFRISSIEDIVALNLNHIYPYSFVSFGATQEKSVVFLIDEGSWLLNYLWGAIHEFNLLGFNLLVTHSLESCPSADVCVVLGYTQILNSKARDKFRSVVVVHESPLPEGRGWSPMTWRVLEGIKEMTLTLFEAADDVDSGDIYLQSQVALTGVELIEDLRRVQASESFRLIEKFLSAFPKILGSGQAQVGNPSYYPRRHPVDSRCSSASTIDEIFDLLRVSDPDKYPVTFEKNGQIFTLTIKSYNSHNKNQPGE
jgi:UDP-2,4-diacetamido-2,4,6-trideoxy-beta-L-altropyranose hydrolase